MMGFALSMRLRHNADSISTSRKDALPEEPNPETFCKQGVTLPL